MVLAKHLTNTPSSGLLAFGRAALMMTRGFQDSLDLWIITITHCSSDNKVSRMHRFSEIMLKSSHVFTHFGPIPGISGEEGSIMEREMRQVLMSSPL